MGKTRASFAIELDLKGNFSTDLRICGLWGGDDGRARGGLWAHDDESPETSAADVSPPPQRRMRSVG